MNLVLYTVLSLILVNAIYAFQSHLQNRKLRKRRIEKLTGITDSVDYEDKWFTQNLDHSDPTNPETWQQRYFVNDKYFNQDNRSVIFLEIGGEAEISATFMDWGFVGVNLSSDFSALFIQLEHRFYGNSKPKEDLSLENLRYLTSEQALGDIANFILKVDLNVTFQHPPQWIVFGGSYAGSLSAWFKLKYPHLVKGAVASSAPLHAKLDFPEYYEVVATDLKNVNEECYSAVGEATTEMELQLDDVLGRNYLYNTFKLCDPLHDLDGKPNTTRFDIMNLFVLLSGNFADIAQYDDPTGSKNLNWVCSILTNTTNNKTAIERLADFNEQILEVNEAECLDYKYTNFDLTDVTYGGDIWVRQWVFQICNEFGFFQTSSNKTSKIFGQKFPVDFYLAMCTDAFGDGFQKNKVESSVTRTNRNYGGLNYTVDNVVFVHGTVDPWHTVGLLESKNDKTKSILINGTSHCFDMNAPTVSDPEELVEARKTIKILIGSWLD